MSRSRFHYRATAMASFQLSLPPYRDNRHDHHLHGPPKVHFVAILYAVDVHQRTSFLGGLVAAGWTYFANGSLRQRQNMTYRLVRERAGPSAGALRA